MAQITTFNLVTAGPVIDVRAYGATGNGTTDDTTNIQAAINAAGAVKGTVFFPAGIYRISSGLNVGFSDLTVLGSLGAKIQQTADHIAILCDTVISNLTIKDITVTSAGFGQNDAGLITLNKVTNLLVQNCKVLCTDFSAAGIKKVDGIATSQGTSGLIQSCVVDGTSKPGFYCSTGTSHVKLDSCEAKNCTGWTEGSVQVAPGFSMGACDHISLVNCQAHGNSGPGVLMGIVGNPGSEVAVTYVNIVGGQFDSNGTSGINVGSASASIVPQYINISGVSVTENTGYGITLEAGQDICISNVICARNTVYGILIQNPSSATNIEHTSRITLSNIHLKDNAIGITVEVGGIGVKACDRITIRDIECINTLGIGGGCYQTHGVDVLKNGAVFCTNLKIENVDAEVGIAAAYPFPVFSTDAATSGHYSIKGAGSPHGQVHAPAGSTYIDTNSTTTYKKVTGSNQNGWRASGFGAAAPVAGTWAVGDLVYDSAPAAGGNLGWVCTVAGTPGTWKPFGPIGM